MWLCVQVTTESLSSWFWQGTEIEQCPLQRCLENCKEQSSVRRGLESPCPFALWSSRQVVVLLLPRRLKEQWELLSFRPHCVAWPPGCTKVGWQVGVAFCPAVIIVGLRNACAVKSVVPGGMSQFGEGSWCQVNS